ncbi:unnamed protein product [marine sediment metagenome]|uniref:Uncharacterized protein n=1 Tax=marine sediment metagenome TaxID=412755 RepID=X1EG77_9ZZZZ
MEEKNMDFIRKIINSDLLQNIFEIPISLKHKKVEILILPVEKFDQYTEKKHCFMLIYLLQLLGIAMLLQPII